jgi:hypothetical protein
MQKFPEQKNNRPLQVELENGRSQLQNDFQIWGSALRGFIVVASRADVYTSANLLGQGPSICCRRPFCRLKAPLGLSLLRCAPQTRILLCKMLVGKSQTLELHPLDADLASPNEKVYGSNTLSAIGKQLFPVKKENSND